jgi:hypothetical protein
MIVLPVVMLHAVLLAAAVAICNRRGRRPKEILGWMVTATVAAYFVVSCFAVARIQRLQSEFPYESVRARLPSSPRDVHPIAEETIEGLASLENSAYGADGMSWAARERVSELEQLHERVFQVFISEPGFGVTRMSGLSEHILRDRWGSNELMPQPGPRSTSDWSTEANVGEPARLSDRQGSELRVFHLQGVEIFSPASSFGYFKDRDRVAGFRTHGFGQAPESPPSWRLRTLDLVGIVVHAQPVAYVSDYLPRMEELAKAPKRPLDAFESRALDALRSGKLLVAEEFPGRMKALGALRATKQCIDCHDCQQGRLLGAFSYTFDAKAAP